MCRFSFLVKHDRCNFERLQLTYMYSVPGKNVLVLVLVPGKPVPGKKAYFCEKKKISKQCQQTLFSP